MINVTSGRNTNMTIEPNRQAILDTLKTIEDRELFLDIVSLGLIYKVGIAGRLANIDMTFTSPLYPFGQELLCEVEQKVRAVPGVEQVHVNVTWHPQWEPSAEIKSLLGIE
jgi:metal-sulfur cluster biosynthetic enzyme